MRTSTVVPILMTFFYGFLTGAAIAAVVTLLISNLVRADAPVRKRMPPHYPVTGARFRRVLGVMLGPPLTAGNQIDVLENGDEIFPAMLEAVRSAESTINFESYIYWSGEIAQTFAEALIEKARAGLDVNVLLDWVGSAPMDPELIDKMRDAGACVERYRPPTWTRLNRFNHRTHRKLLIVDGRVGFTGGVGIGDEWTGDAQDPDHWRDLHFRVRGPVVAQLQAGFLDNWKETNREMLLGEEHFPLLETAGEMAAQNIVSSPAEGSQSVQLLFLFAIAGARETLRVATPYFVPDSVTFRTLLDAAERGVKIQIILPGHHTDSDLSRRASQASWGEMLEAGIEIYEYEPTMYHSKMMVVDSFFVTVGSTNLDNRSFRLNDESNLNVADHALAAELDAVFEKDLAKSRKISLERWRKRPWRQKLWERCHTLVKSQL